MAFRALALLGLLLPLASAQDASQHPVDRILEGFWKSRGIAPGEASTDTEFLRRANLDIIGVIPTSDEARAFLADERPDKRRRTIETLTSSKAFAGYWAEKLTNDWLGYGGAFFDNSRAPFKKWLREQLLEGTRYPDIVSRIVSAEAASAPGGFVRRWILVDFTNVSPENAANRVSRSFLGLQLHCAQCHDHPFDRWTREDFYGMAAFFSGFSYDQQLKERPSRSFKPEGYKAAVPQRFLDGTAPEGKWPRGELAQWISKNDALARAICNRVWAYLFGRGIVEPWDDLGAQGKTSVPGLLEALVEDFKKSGGDLRALVRFVASSQAYQQTSEKLNAADGEFFSRAAVRPMLPEQLMNSLMRATGIKPRGSDYNDFKGEFAKLFYANRGFEGSDLTQYRGTVQQVLKMLELDNTIYDGARVNGGGMLDALLAKHKSPEDVFDAMYLAALSRAPSERERETCVKTYRKWDEYLNAYEDVFWALLNSNEFFFNH